jgi:ribosomal 50S subunit-associated protein YjgA (DUF615 family)
MTSGSSGTAKETLERLRDYQRTLEGLSRIGGEKLPPERLMHHVSAQLSRVTHIARRRAIF